MPRFGRNELAYIVLAGILIIVIMIIFEFYGYSNFLNGIEHKEAVPLLLVVIIAATILVMLQRVGIIFADRQF